MEKQQRLELIALEKLYPEEAKKIRVYARKHNLPEDWMVLHNLWCVHMEKTESPHDLDVGNIILCNEVGR